MNGSEKVRVGYSLAEYEALIEQEFIAPYIKPEHTVLEIGIGGGKTGCCLNMAIA